MAQITKKQLKGILKECLREILKEEGFVLSESAKNNVRSSPNSNLPSKNKHSSRAPSIKNNRLMENVNNLAASFGDDSQGGLYRKLFEDTAATTLQEQNGAGHGAGAGGMSMDQGNVSMPATPEQAAADENELAILSHDGDVSRWASVAFANKG